MRRCAARWTRSAMSWDRIFSRIGGPFQRSVLLVSGGKGCCCPHYHPGRPRAIITVKGGDGVAKEHDKGYKELLSNKRIFLELVRTFIRDEWVGAIDEQGLVRVDKSYILKEFTEIESDIVYRIQRHDRDIIFYILLELQSKVDFSMPIRLFGYMVEIWRDILNNTSETARKRKKFRLPVIIPAVLYNGEQRWTAARRFKEIQAGYESFGDYVLDFRYILFDVNRYDDQDLREAANVISTVFFLDKRTSYTEILDRIKLILKIVRKFDPDQLRLALQWAEHVFIPRLPESIREGVEHVLREATLQEVENVVTNLGIALDEMKKDAKVQGMKEGKKEGIKEGMKEGKREGKKEVARNMLLDDVPVDKISKFTGLSPSEIDELKKQLRH